MLIHAPSHNTTRLTTARCAPYALATTTTTSAHSSEDVGRAIQQQNLKKKGNRKTFVLGIAETEDHLRGIIDLQQKNLPSQIANEQERLDQGYLSVANSLDELRDMKAECPQVVAFDPITGNVVGYRIFYTRKQKENSCAFQHMWSYTQEVDCSTLLGGVRHYLTDPDRVGKGQTCIAKEFRGCGMFEALYKYSLNLLSSRYTHLFARISADNTRSRRAHEKVGFEELCRFKNYHGIDSIGLVLRTNHHQDNDDDLSSSRL